ncbi:MAG TPA: glycosyltransferase family A protein [Pyrinomonadaceae bacterium]|jgi:glycosyltransferase involved in cell wall biosynthesis|nr:glycosyltransferase family A protein [Pyrinomonadaceae bacterium]
MDQTTNPQISVVMPVHNGIPFLDESIKSILAQTISDFEFVILDDGSTDGSAELLREWAQRDARIQLHHSSKQLGLAGSSNAVVSKARALIVARMDADDIAHPDRLRRQLGIMESHPEIVVIGTLCDGIDASGRVVRPRDRWRLLRRSAYIPFPHGSTMFRRKAFEEVGGYNELMMGAEDQDLFRKMATKGRVVTLADTLYSYRYHLTNATLQNGTTAVSEETHPPNDALAGLYMMGAMRLWAGHPPQLLVPMFKKKSLHWTPKTLLFLAPALLGHISAPTLRVFLRSFIRARDLFASLRVKDGRYYEWRLD